MKIFDLKNILILLVLVQICRQECKVGCLRCNDQQKCLVCDVLQFYKLEGDTCVEIQLENCLQINNLGQCQQCLPGYYVNLTTKTCEMVSPVNTVDNCYEYSNSQTCISCKENYYLSSGQCVIIATPVSNCRKYKRDGECQYCINNYVITNGGSQCEIGNTQPYCQSFQTVSCLQCQNGYILNYNQKSQSIFKYSNQAQVNEVIKYINESAYEGSSFESAKVCEQIQLENCQIPLTATTCENCSKGFYIDKQGKCQKNPAPKIDYCINYDPNYSCIECSGQYYLKDNICIDVEPIENCVIYDGTSPFSQCKECNSDYFVQGSTCVERITSKSIQFCRIKNPRQDQCLECQDNYKLSTDKVKCFPQVSNCIEHSNISSTGTEVNCQKCSSGYVLINSQTCQIGDISRCDEYVSLGVCRKCENQFYLSEGQCLPSTDIPQCSIYSTILKDTCQQCSDNYFNFLLKNVCTTETQVENCIEYDEANKTSCINCKDSYELQGNTCVPITIPNCVQVLNGECSACSRGHALDYKTTTPTCEQLPDSFTENCQVSSLDQDKNDIKILDAGCWACKQYTQPIDHRTQFYCLENDMLHIANISQENLISDCIKYDTNGKCVQCDNGKLLTPQKTCANQCTANSIGTYYRVLEANLPNGHFMISSYNICDENQSQVPFCEMAAPNKQEGNARYVCLKCLPGYLNEIDIRNFLIDGYSLVNPDKNTLPYIESPVAIHPEVSCLLLANTNVSRINGNFAKIEIPNCKYYSKVGTSSSGIDYGCSRCQHGYAGNVVLNYINFCVNITTNNGYCTNDYLDGADLIWQFVFSCHVCKNQSQIPFVMMETRTLLEPSPSSYTTFSLSNMNWKSQNDPNAYSVQCLQPMKQSFGIPQNLPFSFPENCGLGFVNLLYNSGQVGNNTKVIEDLSIDQLAIYCAACKPGYQATPINSFYKFVKVRCELISNCAANSRWFNYCSQCNPGFVYEWGFSKIQYDKCIKGNTNNCYAEGMLDNQQRCLSCNKGYTLNLDFQCEKIIPPHCDVNTDFNLRTTYYGHPFYSYYHSQQGMGCAKCESGYTAVQVNPLSKNNYICTRSSYLESKQASLTKESNYIPKCLYYSIFDNLIHCAQCQQGYLLSDQTQEKECILAPANCLQLNKDDKCSLCAHSYALVNDKCIKGNIANCDKYNDSVNDSVQKCITCKIEYYLTSQNTCKKSKVTNCKKLQLNSGVKCEECQEGFILTENQNQDYCFPIDQSLNCLQGKITPDSTFGALFECTKCSQANATILPIEQTSQEIKTKCLPFAKIDNCLTYETKQIYSDNTFICQRCSDDFYLGPQGNQCIERSNKNLNCIEYEISLDKCKVCEESFILNFEGICEPLPSGVTGCLEYNSSVECIKCDQKRFLSQGQCLEVNSEQQIENCVFYSENGVCEECKNNYFLTENQCLKAVASNCKTYTDINTCATCEIGYTLQLDSKGALNCLQSNKPNCQKLSDRNDRSCEICSKGYFVNVEGNCSKVVNAIKNCRIYLDEGICQICEQGTVLNSDGTQCDSINTLIADYDENCQEFQNIQQCSICRQGAYFQGDQCVLCPNYQSCARCSIDNPYKCELCQTGFYMNDTGTCLRNRPIYTAQQSAKDLLKISLFFWLNFL